MLENFYAVFIAGAALMLIFSKPAKGDDVIIAALGAMALITLLLSF